MYNQKVVIENVEMPTGNNNKFIFLLGNFTYEKPFRQATENWLSYFLTSKHMSDNFPKGT